MGCTAQVDRDYADEDLSCWSLFYHSVDRHTLGEQSLYVAVVRSEANGTSTHCQNAAVRIKYPHPRNRFLGDRFILPQHIHDLSNVCGVRRSGFPRVTLETCSQPISIARKLVDFYAA